MRITAQDFYSLYSPSECSLRVWLRSRNEPEAEPGAFEQVLFKLGQRHESNHLATFSQVADLRAFSREDRARQTLKLVANKTAVLYQPRLTCSTTIAGVECEIVGEPDFLILENDGYVVRDVKLIRKVDEENHPEAVLQLQLYAWLYQQVFGQTPVSLEVFNGLSELVRVPNDVDNVMQHLRKIVELKTRITAPYAPVGWSKCTGCGFHDPCWKEAKAGNDVSLVYGVDQGLAVALHENGVQRIERLIERFDETELAAFQRPWGDRVQKVGKSAGAILRSTRSLLTGAEIVLARPVIPEREHFVMFDLEGLPPQLDELGKIYLWGMQVFGKSPGEFQPVVARFGGGGDEQGWCDFLHRSQAIFDQHGDIPFVHWASYERTQINEYIRRYDDPNGTAVRVLANLLDLLPVTRQAIVLPVHSYSLKVIEKYVGFERTQSEFGGSWSMARYIEATETEDEAMRNQVMAEILVYNQEDLMATWAVLQWLLKKV